jgi:hypothetical protein
MTIDKKFEQQLIDFPKLYKINCQECEGEIEYKSQRRDDGKYAFRYEYACYDCGLITYFREMMDELQSKWPYNVICKKTR